MSAHALSPRPVDFLPPTLQPHAIAQSAPDTDRSLSFLVTFLLYSSLIATCAFLLEAVIVLSPWALLGLGGRFFWRRRRNRQEKSAEPPTTL